MSSKPIHVVEVMPPIPVQHFDYSAYRDGYEPGDPMGTGATREAAIADLLEQEKPQ